MINETELRKYLFFIKLLVGKNAKILEFGPEAGITGINLLKDGYNVNFVSSKSNLGLTGYQQKTRVFSIDEKIEKHDLIYTFDFLDNIDKPEPGLDSLLEKANVAVIYLSPAVKNPINQDKWDILLKYIKNKYNPLFISDFHRIIIYSKKGQIVNLRPLISICIPIYKRKNILLQSLKIWENSININPGLIEVVIIENASTEFSGFDFSQHYKLKIKYLNTKKKNIGLARKKSVEIASSDLLLLVNDDTFAFPDLLIKHIEYQLANVGNKFAVLGKFILHPEVNQNTFTKTLDESICFFKQNFFRENVFEKPGESFVTNNLSITREAILKAGNFSLKFKGAAEDTEMGLRLGLNGYKILFKSDLLAHHFHRFNVISFLKLMEQRGIGANLLNNRIMKLTGSKSKISFKKNYIEEFCYLYPIFENNIKNYNFENNRKDLNNLIITVINKLTTVKGILKNSGEYIPRQIPSANKKEMVTIVIYQLNNSTIKEILASIINQGYKNWEVLLINNESNDLLTGLLNSFPKTNNMEIVPFVRKNFFQKTFNLIKGKFIIFLGPDYCLMPGSLELLLNKWYSLKKPKLQLLYGQSATAKPENYNYNLSGATPLSSLFINKDFFANLLENGFKEQDTLNIPAAMQERALMNNLAVEIIRKGLSADDLNFPTIFNLGVRK
jgi:glycosyltransferase involved in cell wall biosynthesis